MPDVPQNSVFGGRRARLALEFTIIGASIAGLACAYNLAQAGHKVHVLEKRNGMSKVRRSPTLPSARC